MANNEHNYLFLSKDDQNQGRSPLVRLLETIQSLQDETYLDAYSHHPKQLNRFRQLLPLPPNAGASMGCGMFNPRILPLQPQWLNEDPSVVKKSHCRCHQMLPFLHSNQFTSLHSKQYKYYYRLPLLE